MRKMIVCLVLGMSLCFTACGSESVEEADVIESSESQQSVAENNFKAAGVGQEDVLEVKDQGSTLLEKVKSALGITSTYSGKAGTGDDGSDDSTEIIVTDGTSTFKMSSDEDFDTGGGIAQKDHDSGAKVDSVDNELDSNESSDLSAYSEKTIEFVSYPSQTISENKAMVFTNLSSNEGTCIRFTLEYEGKTKESELLKAGESWSVTANDLGLSARTKAYSVKVLSQGYTEEGTKLNGVTQEISVKVEDGAEKEVASSTYKDQTDGTKYNTAVEYLSDNTYFATIVPAVVTVNQGDVGADVFVSFRALNAKDGMVATVKATNDKGKAKLTLTGGSKEIEATLSSAESTKAVLSHTFEKSESALQEVGPIHCSVKQGKKAGRNYYGVLNFGVTLSM